MKTLVTYQVTNDNSLSCLHKLNTSIVQTRLVNVLRTQRRLHNSTRTTLTQRQQAKPIGWIRTRLRKLWYLDESSPPVAYRWTCIIQRHHTRSYLVYYITRKH